MTSVSWKDILWGSVNMNRLNWWEIDWADIDYQTFFNIMLYCYRDTNSRDITTLLRKNDKSLRDFVKDQEAWSRKNENNDYANVITIVKRYLSQMNKSVNQRIKRTGSSISFC